MLRILSVKDEAVTRGVLDKDVHHEPNHREITFMANDGTPHTIFAHVDGPFSDPEEAVAAWERGELHPDAEDRSEQVEPLQPAGPVLGAGANPPRPV